MPLRSGKPIREDVVRARLTLLAALAGALALLVVGVGTGSALVTKPKSTFKCVLKDYTQTPGKLTGFDLGFVACTGPFGAGVQSDSYKETVNGKTGKITSKGGFKDYYNTGTVHGVYKLSGKLSSATTGTFKGSVAITGGTGAFKGASGGGTLSCVTHNGGKSNTCTATIKGSAV
jgi:hypothetical protein